MQKREVKICQLPFERIAAEAMPNFFEQFLAVYQDPIALKKLIDAGGNVDTVFISFDKREWNSAYD